MDPNDLRPPAIRPKTVKCAQCRKTIKVKAKGVLPFYCSNKCKQAAWYVRSRLAQLHKPLSADEQQRILTWQLLQDAGLVPLDAPLPEPRAREGSKR